MAFLSRVMSPANEKPETPLWTQALLIVMVCLYVILVC